MSVRKSLATLLVAASTVLGSVAVAPAASAAPAPAMAQQPFLKSSGCGHVFVLGARGSGQDQEGVWNRADSNFDGGTGLGPQVYTATKAVIEKVANPRVVVRQALVYPALDVPKSLRPSSWQNFLAGFGPGVEKTIDILNARLILCPNERIVLAGYSQGAMVMHRVVLRLAERGRINILNRISGVILIADGDRLNHDNHVRYGSAGELFRGVAHEFLPVGAINRKFPANMASRIHSVCNARDIVCDHWPGNVAIIPTAISNHLKYTNGVPVLRAGAAVAAETLRHPIITLATSARTGIVTEPPYTFHINRPGLVSAPANIALNWESQINGIMSQKRASLAQWISQLCDTDDPNPHCDGSSSLEASWSGRPVLASQYASIVMVSTYYAAGAGVNQNDADTLTMSLVTGRVLQLPDVLNVSGVYAPLVGKMTAEGLSGGGCDYLGPLDISDVKDYTAGWQGITFWFDRYQASYGACSQTWITLTWQEVGPFLTATGRNLRMVAA